MDDVAIREAVRADRRRIARIYDDYWRADQDAGPSDEDAAGPFIRDMKWRALDALVGMRPAWRSGAWALDLGAGPRSDLADHDLPKRPGVSGILAVDLLAQCTRALGCQAGVVPVLGHAAILPVASGSVSVVYQSLMLSSVIDPGLRRSIYAEISRVTAPGGLFVSYDTRYVNPWNADTRPVSLRELRGAFAGWRQRHRTLTGLPPLLRWLAPASRGLCRAVESVPPLRSHRLFVAEKPADA